MNIDVKYTLRARIKEIDRQLPYNTKTIQKEMLIEQEAHEEAIKVLEDYWKTKN